MRLTNFAWTIFKILNMQKTVAILLLFGLIYSCNTITDPPDISDSILYTNLDPDVMISTVERYETETLDECTTEIPVPEDSVVNYWLDINGDDQDDFILDISHRKLTDNHECGPCSIYEYQMTISGAGGNNYISFDPAYTWVPKWYSLNDTIRPNHSWNKEVFVLMQGGCDRWIVDLKDIYIGIKHNMDFGWIHIKPAENNGIVIMEYAINQTDNRPIAAGQKK